MLQIWERLLKPGRRIGVFEDFFEIGGHSLLAIQMIGEVQRVRGQRIPLAWLFEASTIASLAARLAARQFAEPEQPLVVVQGDTEMRTQTLVVFYDNQPTGRGMPAALRTHGTAPINTGTAPIRTAVHTRSVRFVRFRRSSRTKPSTA